MLLCKLALIFPVLLFATTSFSNEITHEEMNIRGTVTVCDGDENCDEFSFADHSDTARALVLVLGDAGMGLDTFNEKIIAKLVESEAIAKNIGSYRRGGMMVQYNTRPNVIVIERLKIIDKKNVLKG